MTLIASLCRPIALRDEVHRAGLEDLNTLAFVEPEGLTTTLLQVVVPRAVLVAHRPLQGMELGWRMSLDQLEVEMKQALSADSGDG